MSLSGQRWEEQIDANVPAASITQTKRGLRARKRQCLLGVSTDKLEREKHLRDGRGHQWEEVVEQVRLTDPEAVV